MTTPVRLKSVILALAIAIAVVNSAAATSAGDDTRQFYFGSGPLPDMTEHWDACQAASVCYMLVILEGVKHHYITQLEAVVIRGQLEGLHSQIYGRSTPNSFQVNACAVQYNYMFRTVFPPEVKIPIRDRCIRLMDEQYSSR